MAARNALENFQKRIESHTQCRPRPHLGLREYPGSADIGSRLAFAPEQGKPKKQAYSPLSNPPELLGLPAGTGQTQEAGLQPPLQPRRSAGATMPVGPSSATGHGG